MAKSEKEIKALAAISISIFAALLAINTLMSGANSSKILNNTINANNMWAWYQAKNIRQVVYETHGKVEEAKRMQADKDELAGKAKALEMEREDARLRSPFYTYAGSLLQIGIVVTEPAHTGEVGRTRRKEVLRAWRVEDVGHQGSFQIL